VTPMDMGQGAARLAVQSNKFKIDQTRVQLESAREEFRKHSERMIEQQKSIAKTISEMTRLTMTNQSLKEMLPVLKEAVTSFNLLRARFSQLAQFFSSVSSLLSDVMGPKVGTWVKTLTAAETDSLAGVTMSAWTRDCIYRQMMIPLKVGMLTEKISGTYLKVSNGYIMPAQRQVGSLMQFARSGSEADQTDLRAKLNASQIALEQTSIQACESIVKLVQDDQKQFTSSIDNRLEKILGSISGTAPALVAPVSENIRQIAAAHVEEVEAVNAEKASANPMFNASLAM